jgi:N-acetylmuramoyl-L-alanine amidase
MVVSPTKLTPKNKKLKGLELDCFRENNLYKYTYGSFSSFEEANSKRREFRKSFPDAFVIAFRNGQKMPIQDARAQSKH